MRHALFSRLKAQRALMCFFASTLLARKLVTPSCHVVASAKTDVSTPVLRRMERRKPGGDGGCAFSILDRDLRCDIAYEKLVEQGL
jgi:hypothetical protein